VPTHNPLRGHPNATGFGCHTKAQDGKTTSGVSHRALTQEENGRGATINQIRSALIEHHASPEMIARDRRKIANLIRQGYSNADADAHRFPRVDKTRKGNLVEVFLAEYLGAATAADLPVYRLRYNPNVEQSMKGDDVLAFDFSAARPRIIVGESKFRKTPSKAAVEEIVSGLVRSYEAGLPASLQFVADRLYEADNVGLGDRVSDCAVDMANGRLDLSYVGLLLSTTAGKSKIDEHTEGNLETLVMISLGVDDPEKLVADCFEGIEEEAYADPG
jgi:hypothetical protein